MKSRHFLCGCDFVPGSQMTTVRSGNIPPSCTNCGRALRDARGPLGSLSAASRAMPGAATQRLIGMESFE